MGLFSLLPKQSDAKVVHVARQWLRWQRRVGVVYLMVAGLIVVGLAGYLADGVLEEIAAEQAWVEASLAGGEGESEDSEHANAVVRLLMLTQLSFMVGTMIGWKLVLGVAIFVVAFRWLLTRDREREILVALWDAAAADEGETRE